MLLKKVWNAPDSAGAREWTWQFETADGTRKDLQLIFGSLCEKEEKCDVAVCSAFVGNYSAVPGTLIGSLKMQKNIDVSKLSKDPELDFRSVGGWLSRETGMQYRRIACVEMLPLYHCHVSGNDRKKVINRGFATLRFLLEQASIAGIPVETVATSILGTGNQKMELEYILSVLIAQCRIILTEIPEVKCIRIYEMNDQKALRAARAIDNALAAKDIPDVFISYSTKQMREADVLRQYLQQQQISCWMAPYSIPTGSDYASEISSALSGVKAVVLLLTEDAIGSVWVEKEVLTALSARKMLLPYQPYEVKLDGKYSFILQGVQIWSGNAMDEKDLDCLITEIRKVGC